MTEAKMTPMLRQYRRLKQRYPDAPIFYHLGDFYELCKTAARESERRLAELLDASVR